MRSWIAIFAVTIIFIVAFGDCSTTGLTQEEQTIYVFTPEMDDRLYLLKEDSMDIILQECDYYYIDFYYCSLSRMYDMNHVIRYYENFAIDMDEGNRSAVEISKEFEVLNHLMTIHKRKTDFGDFTFDFETVLIEYEFYLETKEVMNEGGN